MIELGTLSVKTSEDFKEARRKIRNLTESLGYDAINSTRLVTVFSELIRNGRYGNFNSDITIGLEKRNGQYGLSLVFSYGENVPLISSADRFFDSLFSNPPEGTETTVTAFKYLSDSDFRPSDELIETQRQMLSKLSGDQLLLDLQQKNDELKAAAEEIRNAKNVAEQVSEDLRNKLDELALARRAMLNIMEDIEDARKTTEEALNIISSSISYASHIQQAILPDNNLFTSWFSDHFIIWEPRDVVGGDIYYGVPWNNGLLLALGDCTGHGVPGAFMTLITTAALSRARSETEHLDIARIVKRMHQIVQKNLNQNVKEGTSDDGMELGLCYFDRDMTELVYVGTRFSLFLVEDGQVKEIKGDKKAIGYRGIPFDQEYTENRIALESGQRYYMTTDGLIDQIGGPKRRSYGKKRFKDLILSLADVPFSEQNQRIYNDLVAYQGKESRRDDVSIIGFQI